MQGNLQDFGPIELIQILGTLGKSGVLRLQRISEEGLVVFRDGNIIYASSPSVRESLGSLLLARGLITEAQLDQALERQSSSEEKMRLGAIMVDMEIIQQSTLVKLIRRQFSTVVSEFIHWDAGIFEFESVEMVDRGEVEVEATEFLAVIEVESNRVLLDAARRADEKAHHDETADVQTPSLDVLMEQSTSPTIQGEIVHRLLDLGTRTCGRCVLFVVHSDRFLSIGRVGLDKRRVADAQIGSRLEVSRSEQNILSRATDQEHSVLARLPISDDDNRILDFLGGSSPSKSVAIPLSSEGQVILVLYGDHFTDDIGTGLLEEVEIAASSVVARSGE